MSKKVFHHKIWIRELSSCLVVNSIILASLTIKAVINVTGYPLTFHHCFVKYLIQSKKCNEADQSLCAPRTLIIS